MAAFRGRAATVSTGRASSRPRRLAAALAVSCALAGGALPAIAGAAGFETFLVSRATGADGAKANHSSFPEAMSADGQRVLFHTHASNLDPADPDAERDVFVRDLVAGTTTLVSRATGFDGAKGNGLSEALGFSADGQRVLFLSSASNLDPADTDTVADLFVRDLAAGTTALVTRANGLEGRKANGSFNPRSPRLSPDGRRVMFSSTATNLDPADTDATEDLFVRDLAAGTTLLVSRANGSAGAKGNGNSTTGLFSADGRFVVFNSRASNLDPADRDTAFDVFVRDLARGTTALVSRASQRAGGAKGNRASALKGLSANGQRVLFGSRSSNLHSDDTDTTNDLFVRDLAAGTTALVSRATGSSSAKGNRSANAHGAHAMSADGQRVLFESGATNLDPADTDSGQDVFVRDLAAGTTWLVSRATGSGGARGNDLSAMAALSADGQRALFFSRASNLDPADGDGLQDVFVRDLGARTTSLVSRASGAAGAKANAASTPSALSADGRRVLFWSDASNLDPMDADADVDVFVRNVFDSLARPRVTLLGGPSSVRSGRSAVFRYLASAAGSVRLEVLRGRRVVARVTRRTRGGRGSIVWNGRAFGRARLEPGGYTVRLTIRRSDGQTDTDRGRLVVRR